MQCLLQGGWIEGTACCSGVRTTACCVLQWSEGTARCTPPPTAPQLATLHPPPQDRMLAERNWASADGLSGAGDGLWVLMTSGG